MKRLLCIIVLLLICFSLASCAGIAPAKAKETLSLELDTLKGYSIQELAEFLSEKNMQMDEISNQDAAKILHVFTSNITYEIISVEQSSTSATAKVLITTKSYASFKDRYNTLAKEYQKSGKGAGKSDEELNQVVTQLLIEAARYDKLGDITNEATVEMVKSSLNWQVLYGASLQNAIFGKTPETNTNPN